jgi:Ankyrin repeats (many copies)
MAETEHQYYMLLVGTIELKQSTIHKDFDPNTRNNKMATPLHYACNHGYNEVVEKLLEHCDIDINARDSSYETPLHALFVKMDRPDIAGYGLIVQYLCNYPLNTVEMKMSKFEVILCKIQEKIDQVTDKLLTSPNDPEFLLELV